MATLDCSGVARTSIGWWEAQPFINPIQQEMGAAGEQGRKADGHGRGKGQGRRVELGIWVRGHAGRQGGKGEMTEMVVVEFISVQEITIRYRRAIAVEEA